MRCAQLAAEAPRSIRKGTTGIHCRVSVDCRVSCDYGRCHSNDPRRQSSTETKTSGLHGTYNQKWEITDNYSFTGEFIRNKPVSGRVYSSCPVKRLTIVNWSNDANNKENVCMCTRMYYSFIPAISIAPLQVLHHSEALPTTAQIVYRSFTPKRTGNCR